MNEWPAKKNGVEINLNKIAYSSVSMYVDQFDEVCSAAIADITASKIKSMDTYKLYTDTRGHNYFRQTNQYGAAIQGEVNIESG